MAVACIILVVIAVLGIGLAFYYRRQIKNVKNQISFLNQHETNMLITSDQKSGCVAELTDELNTLPYKFPLKMTIRHMNRLRPVKCLIAFIKRMKREAQPQQD